MNRDSCAHRCCVRILTILLLTAATLCAQTPASPQAVAGTDGGSIAGASLAGLQLEMTNAMQRVIGIVNRPVRAFKRTPEMKVSVSQNGWFHEGAHKPNFLNVDVRQTQDTAHYASRKYITSTLNPGVVFLGAELEFNASTKYFYTNYTLPKAKLTEAEMLEINRLYRIIGRCQREIGRLTRPVTIEAEQSEPETEMEVIESGQPLADIRSIPSETRLIYGGLAIAFLIVVFYCVRVFCKRRA